MRPDRRFNLRVASARYGSQFCNGRARGTSPTVREGSLTRLQKMKAVGIIGGIGPESTIEYYRFIIEGYRARKGDGSYPSIMVNSIDLSKLLAWMNADQLDEAADYLLHEIERLARAG